MWYYKFGRLQRAGFTSCMLLEGRRQKIYFDSFGVVPPTEMINYLKSPILCSTYQIQKVNESNCSEWCLFVLNELHKLHSKTESLERDFMDVILTIINFNDNK
jgi:hypothetical protein